MQLTIDQAEDLVQQSANVRWDGWDLVLYRQDPNAFMRSAGRFFDGSWCLRTVIQPNAEGKYFVGKSLKANIRPARA